jgi:hypothetical protein
MLAFCIITLAVAGLVQPKEFQFVNRGSQTIWIGILGNEVLEHGGFALASGQQVRRKTSRPWSQMAQQPSSEINLMTVVSFLPPREWRYRSITLNLSTRWVCVVSFKHLGLCFGGNSPRHPLDKRLDGSQILSGRYAEEKNLLPSSHRTPISLVFSP